MANLLYHLTWLNQINSCDVEFGSLQHFACKVSELYPIPTRYYVRAVGRNYILFLFSFLIREIHGQYPVVTPATKQFLQQFEAQSRKSKKQHIKVILLFCGLINYTLEDLVLKKEVSTHFELTSLCLTRLHYDSPVSSLLIKLVQFVYLMENWCNQLSKIPYWTLLWYPLILWKHLSLWLASVLSWKSSPR